MVVEFLGSSLIGSTFGTEVAVPGPNSVLYILGTISASRHHLPRAVCLQSYGDTTSQIINKFSPRLAMLGNSFYLLSKEDWQALINKSRNMPATPTVTNTPYDCTQKLQSIQILHLVVGCKRAVNLESLGQQELCLNKSHSYVVFICNAFGSNLSCSEHELKVLVATAPEKTKFAILCSCLVLNSRVHWQQFCCFLHLSLDFNRK